MLQRCGTRLLVSSKTVKGNDIPASFAIADKCSVVFVDPPRAISTAMAFSNASFFRMAEGVMLPHTSLTILSPVSLAIRAFKALLASAVPQYGSDIPKASVTQAMLLAVHMPLQEPQPGHAEPSNRSNSFSLILPANTWPTASETFEKPIFFPSSQPEAIGPPVTEMAGTFNLAAAMSIPGVTLSQFEIITNPSSLCA